ncbi:MAG: autotransporter domain-containing protein [Xanthobacteraceae bacterium]|nr:autotransporter domain-containing protein [Xanthobacteraceae bacterium]
MRHKKSCVRVQGSRTTVVVLSLLASTAVARAQNATWIGTAGPPNNWNTAANWSPVPSGPPAYVPTGTAFFNSSLTTATTIEIQSGTFVGGLTFTGAPAYTFTLPGTFQINGAGVVADASSAAPTFDVGNGGFFVLTNSATAGPSNVNIVSGGTMILANTSSAGSGIITNSGSVNFNDGSNGGTASIFNSAGASINFNQGGGPLSASAGNATIDNSGTTLFWNSSTAGNATIITRLGGSTIFLNQSSAGASQQTVMAGGQLTFSNGSNAGTSTITNNGTALNFNDTSSAGSAHIINNAGAQMFFSFFGGGSSSASNATIDNSGTLAFGNSSSASNATITTNSGGFTQFTQAATGDTAHIVINGTGVSAATVNIATITASSFTIGSLAGTGGANAQFQIGGKTLIVGSDNRSTSYGGVIFDAGSGGSLTKVGSGTLTLSFFSTYAGTTTVSNGGLHVTGGTLTSTTSVLVGPAGTLSGNGGIVTSGTVTINGTLAPGNPTGLQSLTINAPSLTFGPSAIYRSSFTNGTASLVGLTGAATLGGTLQIRMDSAGVNFGQAYNIFSAGGGVNQQFAAVSAPGAYSTTITYNATSVTASFAPNLVGYAASGNANQQATAAAIQAGLAGQTNAGAFKPLFNLDPSSYLAALSQLSGETATASAPTGFKAMGSFMNVVLNPFIDQRLSGFGPGAPIPYAQELPNAEVALADPSLAYVQKKKVRPAAEEAFASLQQPQATTRDGRFNSWVSGYGAWGKTNGDASSSAVDTRLGGVVGGVDYRPVPGLVFGVAAGGAMTNTSLDSGSADTTVAQVGVYSAVRIDKAYLSAAFAYGWHSVDTSRTVSIAGSDRITAAFDAYSLNGRVETGIRHGWRDIGITPFVAAQVQRFHTPSYQEKAGGAAAPFAISYQANDTNAFRSELGLWFDAQPRSTSGLPINLRARVAWAHNFGDAPTATGAFATIPSGTFVVTGVKPAADALLATAAAEWAVRPGTWLTARFDTEQSRSSAAYSGMGGIRFTW